MITRARVTDHRCDYSTLVLGDAAVHEMDPGAVPSRPAGLVPPASLNRDAPLTRGLAPTLAIAGNGWLHARSVSDLEHDVVLELHDDPPAFDHADWEQACETPYWASSPALGLGTFGGGSGAVALELPHCGLYRLRLARRPRSSPLTPDDDGVEPAGSGSAAPGDDVLVQVWPDRQVRPPRRLAPSGVAVRPPVVQWRDVLDQGLLELAWFVQVCAAELDHPAAGVTKDELDGWRSSRGHVGWLDGEPEAGAWGIAADGPSTQESLTVVAQTGSASCATRREALDALVGLGLLARDGDGGGPARYRYVVEPARPTEFVLPATAVARLRRNEETAALEPLLADLAFVELWRRAAGAEALTVATVAELLLVDPQVVRRLIAYRAEGASTHVSLRPAAAAEPHDVVEVDILGAAVLDDADFTFTADTDPGGSDADSLEALRRRVEQHGARAVPGRMPGRMSVPMLAPSPGTRAAAIVGAPARAGWVRFDGTLVARHDDAWIERPWPGGLSAWQTHYGVLSAGTRNVLVRWDGTAVDLDLPEGLSQPVVSSDGRFVVGVRWRHRTDRYSIHVVDLADLSTSTIAWNERSPVAVRGVHAGSVYLSAPAAHPGIASVGQGFVWRPGEGLVPLLGDVVHVDGASGRVLLCQASDQLVVLNGDGSWVADVAADTLVRFRASLAQRPTVEGLHVPLQSALRTVLAPGGARLLRVDDPGQGSPVTVLLTEVDTGIVISRSAVPAGVPLLFVGTFPAVWEDDDHLLVPVHEPGVGLLRMDVRDAGIEEVGVRLPHPADASVVPRPVVSSPADRVRTVVVPLLSARS